MLEQHTTAVLYGLNSSHLIVIPILCCEASGMPGYPPSVHEDIFLDDNIKCDSVYWWIPVGRRRSLPGIPLWVFCHLASLHLRGGCQLCCRAEHSHSVLNSLLIVFNCVGEKNDTGWYVHLRCKIEKSPSEWAVCVGLFLFATRLI